MFVPNNQGCKLHISTRKHKQKAIPEVVLLFPKSPKFHKALFNNLFYKLYLQNARTPLFQRGLEPNLQGFALNLQGFALQFARFCAELARFCVRRQHCHGSKSFSEYVTSSLQIVNRFNKYLILEFSQEKVSLHQHLRCSLVIMRSAVSADLLPVGYKLT